MPPGTQCFLYFTAIFCWLISLLSLTKLPLKQEAKVSPQHYSKTGKHQEGEPSPAGACPKGRWQTLCWVKANKARAQPRAGREGTHSKCRD